MDNDHDQLHEHERNVAGQEMTIGRLAAAAGVNVETIRHYQRLGLITQPDKPCRGFRRYPPSDVERLKFIRRAQKLGFMLTEIKELLILGGQGQCQDVQRLASQKLEAIEQRLHDLERMRQMLRVLLAQCRAGESDPRCALVEALNNGEPVSG